jgi:diguanylate cyclase (GGDEF)-like protein
MAAPRTLIDALLTTDRRQRIRLAQAWLAFLLTGLCALALHLANALGMVESGPVWWWTGASLAGMFLVVIVIRSGLNERLADPAMTMQQMLYAILCAAWIYTFTGQAHSFVGLILAVILMFGMFGLTTRQVVWVGIYALALFGFVMALSAQRDPDRYPAGGELVYFIMLCIMVAAVGLLTVRLHRMRDRLRRQKVELEGALAHIQRLATHDDLTGLVNRRHMQELLETERMRLERGEQHWCVALIDLDHFKSVNDAHGHAVGDEVLRSLSRQAHTLIRRTDVLARWGGEEFVMLMPDTPIGMGATSLERLRAHVSATPLVIHGIELPVSFSAGLTEHRRGESVAQTLERADKLCYRAKTLGRNRVEHG